MIDQRDREHHDTMLNRLEVMSAALKIYSRGRGRQAGLAVTVVATNTEIAQTMVRAWTLVHDPRWQGPAHFRFIAQRHAELALCYTLIQSAYDELCHFGIIPKEDQTELTTKDMAALAAAEEKLRRRRKAVA